MTTLNNNYIEYTIYSKNIKIFSNFLFELVDYTENLEANELNFYVTNVINLLKLLNVDPVCFLVGLLYLEKIKRKNYKISLIELRLILMTAMLESIKMYDDYGIGNKEYCSFIKMDLHTINLSEVLFLQKMSFELYVKPEEYFDFVKKLNFN